jgi:hypothetical protein
MKLFTLENYQPLVTPEALLIPEIKTLFDRDKSKDKSKALKEIAYVYFSTDFQSNYLSYTKDVRDERLGEDFMGDGKYQPDQLVLTAMQKYDDLQITPTMNFLKAARHAMQETENYFMNIDYSERDAKGNAVYKGTDITKMLRDCSGIKDTLDKLMEAVKKEQSNGGTQRGGGTGGMFEFEED